MKPLIIFGPSGVGKGTIINSLQSKYPDLFKMTLSFTTRKQRHGQINGKHYYFVSKEQFNLKIDKQQMLQHKIVFGNMYGTCKKSVQEVISNNRIPILDVDVEGMIDIQQSIKKGVQQSKTQNKSITIDKPLCLCILPPSYKLLRQRLSGRKTQSLQVVEKRMNENVKQVQRMISLQNDGIENLFYTTNYQYQSTIFGIQSWLKMHHQQFRQYRGKNDLCY